MKKILTMLFVLMVTMSINSSIFAQANSVGLNGSFTFSSITDAYNAIGLVGSPQLIELSSSYNGSTEIIPVLLKPKAGTSAANTITVRPQSGANGLVLSGAVNNGIVRFDTCSFVILDGRPGGVVTSPSNYLSINNTLTGVTNLNAHAVFFVGAQNCTVQFLNANAALGTAAFPGARGVISVSGSIATVSSGNIIIQNNIVVGGQRGIQDAGVAPSNTLNTIIRDNDVSQFFALGIFSSLNTGSLLQNNYVHHTSAIATATGVIGIQNSLVTNGTVTQNIIENILTANTAVTNFFLLVDFGTNSVVTNNKVQNVSGSAFVGQISNVQLSGLGTTNFSGNEIFNITLNRAASFNIGIAIQGSSAPSTINVSKNKIYNLSSTSTTNIRAISTFVAAANAGATMNINNNFISVTQPNNSVSAIFGILAGNTVGVAYNSNIYFNSIRIGGVKIGAAASGLINSYGILKSDNNAASSYRQKNNIILNERTTGDDSTQINLGSYISNISGTLDIDYNTYYATDTLGGFPAAWIDTLYTNAALAAYKAYAFPHESHTNFKFVNFVSNTDLHLAGASIGDVSLAGTPIAGLTTDIDNQIRSTTNPYRGADEATGAALVATLTLTINFQAINVPPSMQAQDTIIVELRSVASGHAIIDSDVGLGGSSIPSTFNFPNAVDGVPYYIVVRHRNSIRTWSSFTPAFSSLSSSYDFTTAQSQAFGNNLVLVNGEWSIFTGDINQDGAVNLTDVLAIKNDNTNFVTGPYVITDLNWNGVVDLNDILFAFNNNVNFVVEKAPVPGPMPGMNLPLVNDSQEGRNAGVYISTDMKSANQVGNTVLMDK